jgi:hypothetical protein
MPCGEGEIRTRGDLRHRGFQDLRTRPLCDLSNEKFLGAIYSLENPG